MPDDRLVLIASTFCFLGAFAVAVWRLLSGAYRSSLWYQLLMGAGFLLQCGVLYLKGKEDGRCPISTPSELLVFVSWGMVLLYWLVGPAYRLSLLGVFTAPLAWIFQVGALAMQAGEERVAVAREAARAHPEFWLELHATVSLLAYSTFALGAVAGFMYLVQDRQLKRHSLGSFFYNLPPLHNLGKGLKRLLVAGFLLLSAGVASAYLMSHAPGAVKLALSWAVWAAYGVILGIQFSRGWAPRQLAWAALLTFLLPLATLWFVAGH